MFAEILACILRPLTRLPHFELRAYRKLSRLKLPGPGYFEMLRRLHAELRPRLYVEIGVSSGGSLRVILPSTHCIAIDPKPADSVLQDPPKNLSLHVMTSDDFFAAPQLREQIRNFDFAFIDGDHSFAQALRDFENLEAVAGPNSVIAIHDVVPIDERTSTPTPQSIFWTGDVWRLMGAIVQDRPDLLAFTVACRPSGLGIVSRFNPARRGISAATVDGFAKMPFVASWKRQRAMLNIVENDGNAVIATLREQPA